MLPLVQPSADILHQALLRGTLRNAATQVLVFISEYLHKDLVSSTEASVKSSADKDKATIKKPQSKQVACDVETAAVAARLDSSRLMVKDLQRHMSTVSRPLLPDLSHIHIEYDDMDGVRHAEASSTSEVGSDVGRPLTEIKGESSNNGQTASMSEAIQLFKKQRRQKTSSSSSSEAAKTSTLICL